MHQSQYLISWLYWLECISFSCLNASLKPLKSISYWIRTLRHQPNHHTHNGLHNFAHVDEEICISFQTWHVEVIGSRHVNWHTWVKLAIIALASLTSASKSDPFTDTLPIAISWNDVSLHLWITCDNWPPLHFSNDIHEVLKRLFRFQALFPYPWTYLGQLLLLQLHFIHVWHPDTSTLQAFLWCFKVDHFTLPFVAIEVFRLNDIKPKLTQITKTSSPGKAGRIQLWSIRLILQKVFKECYLLMTSLKNLARSPQTKQDLTMVCGHW